MKLRENPVSSAYFGKQQLIQPRTRADSDTYRSDLRIATVSLIGKTVNS